MRRTLVIAIGLLSVFGFAVGAARAIPIALINGDFENPVVGGNFQTINGPDTTSLPGWTVLGSIDHIGSYWTAASGLESLDMNGFFAAGTIQQSISFSSAGKAVVSFMLAGNPDNAPQVKTLQVELIGSGGPQVYTFDITGKTHTDMGWVAETAVFNISTIGSYLLQFSSINDPSGAFGPALDNVSVAESVPDGGMTAVLLGMSMLAVGWVRRKVK